ncbi:MAG: cysteine--tRNA ligase [Roseibium sp.]
MSAAETAKSGTFKGLRLTNTLTRQKEDFVPISDENVRLYVCGPTVYDFAHIGNARPIIVFDVLFRLLRHLYGADHVTYARNITDVDDKINARALRDHPDLPLNDAIALVTKKTADQFHKDIKAFGVLEPTHEPRATQHIDGMIKMIEVLIEKGNAYVVKTDDGGEVLFDTVSMPDYGGLSKRKLDEQIAGARIAVESHKKNPGDFVLWKMSSPEEPGWDSPWGRGRPGWHIECSVMSEHHLGKIFDIHGGGLDLIFPHHENEIAQSRCAHGTDTMANYWMHNGFVQVEGKKMSKSDGNFVTIQELLETEKFGDRKWPGEVLRLAMLMTHYKEPIDFSVRKLEEAENILEKWRKPIKHGSVCKADVEPTELPIGFLHAVLDDLNTPKAIRALHEVASKSFGVSVGSGGPPSDLFQPSYNQLYAALKLLGIDLFSTRILTSSEEIDIKEAVIRRRLYLSQADKAKADGERELMKLKFLEADSIRDELATQGILLKDSKDSETGERVTTWEVKR